MPFGLTNAPATYQRAIDNVLRDVQSSLAYIDDTIVYSSDFQDHLTHLRNTLECYRQANMQLRKEKCLFGYHEVEFVGRVISPEGQRPISALVKRIAEHQIPRS